MRSISVPFTVLGRAHMKFSNRMRTMAPWACFWLTVVEREESFRPDWLLAIWNRSIERCAMTTSFIYVYPMKQRQNKSKGFECSRFNKTPAEFYTHRERMFDHGERSRRRRWRDSSRSSSSLRSRRSFFELKQPIRNQHRKEDRIIRTVCDCGVLWQWSLPLAKICVSFPLVHLRRF